MGWAEPEIDRDQMVLFASRLDEAVKPDHMVRVVDQILGRIDWSPMESLYHGRLGQPAIHPRILCSVILYGLICRIRASRKLEEALQVRLDFRWLAHGMSIDHTTLSEFRRKHPQALRDLFVQLVLIGKEMGLVTFERIAFDGTRVRANNRRRGSRSPGGLRETQQRLQQEYDQLSLKADAEDAQDEEIFASVESTSSGNEADEASPQQRLAAIERAQTQVEAALAELAKIEASSETTPKRLATTDPHSRITKCKEGGFAANYTPIATVDCASGMIVDESVIAQSNESDQLLPSLEQIEQDYNLQEPVPEVLADGLMATGANLVACQEKGVTLYSPVPRTHVGDNPALREDLTAPMSADSVASLPKRKVTIAGQKTERFDKQAFVYVPDEDVYRCPRGEALTRSSSYQTKDAGKLIRRTRYRASESSCSVCPLAGQCLSGKSKYRQVDRGEYDQAIESQRKLMREDASESKYSQRRSVGERPFAMIKGVFGLRQFLTRGIDRVSQEWSWATMAFNLHVLVSHIARGP